MNRLDEIIDFLYALVIVGSVLRIILCFVSMMIDEEGMAGLKKRIKNILIFIALSSIVKVFVSGVLSYYM